MARSLVDAWGDLPPLMARRVVVTGLGLVTPLGVGVQRVWERLLAGDVGVRALRPDDLPEAHRAVLPQLPCRVAAMVPQDELAAAPWAAQEDPRRTARFMSYALTAAAEVRPKHTSPLQHPCLPAHAPRLTFPSSSAPNAGSSRRGVAARDGRGAAGHWGGDRSGHELHSRHGRSRRADSECLL